MLVSARFLRECYVAFVLNHTTILIGLTVSFPACLIPQLKREGYSLDTTSESFFGSISFLVSGISTILSVFIIGKAGRKTMMQILLGVYAVGTAIVVLSLNPIMICVGLVIQSSVVSIFGPIIIVYISEVCRKENRGFFLTSMFACITIGLSFTYIVYSFVTWRVIAILTLTVTASAFLQMFLIPESNFWYLLRGEKELAKESILWFEPGLKADELNRRVETIADANDAYQLGKANKLTDMFSDIRRKKTVWQPVVLGAALNTLQCGNGRAIIAVYVETVFRRVDTPYNILGLIRWFGWADIVGTFLVMLFVHKIRRKTLIYASSAVLIGSLSTVIAYTFLDRGGDVLPHWLPVAGVYVYAMCVMAAYNSIIVIIVSEIQVPAYRPQISAFHTGISYFVCSVYCFVFPYAEKILPIQYVFLIFVFNVFAAMVLVACFVPETSKLEFYENEKKSDDGSPATVCPEMAFVH